AEPPSARCSSTMLRVFYTNQRSEYPQGHRPFTRRQQQASAKSIGRHPPPRDRTSGVATKRSLPMPSLLRRALLLAAGLCLPGMPLLAAVPSTPLADQLARSAPKLDKQVLIHALSAMQCAVNHGAEAADRLAVIDFSLPSSERRLWIFDLHSKRLVLKD